MCQQVTIDGLAQDYFKASDAEFWCFLWSAPEQMVRKTIEMLVIWDAISLIMKW